MRKRGVEDFSLAMIDPWAAGYTGEEDAATTRRILRPLTWVRSEPGEHGYARPIEGLVVEFDLDAMAVVAVHDYGVVPLPPKSGNYDARRMADPDNVPQLPLAADRPQADRDHAARGPELHRRGPRGALAEVAAADRLHAARGPGAARHRLRGPRHGAADHLPRLAVGDVRPLRRPGADAPLQERLRHGRVRRRLARQPARARLRLPGRDPLLRRRRQRPGRRADDDPQRHLHARGGRRDRLEAHRLPHRGRRGAAAAAARDLLDRDRRQLRVRVLLVPLHRRHDRVRGQAHGRDLDRRARGRRAARARHAGRPRALRPATTSTSSACGWTWPSTATRTRSCRSTPSPRPIGPENPMGTAWGTKRTVYRSEAEAQAQIDPLRGALLADREPVAGLRARRRGRLQADAG